MTIALSIKLALGKKGLTYKGLYPNFASNIREITQIN